MSRSEHPPIVSVIGRKNSGKTTLVVALAAELKRRGVRVATVKHGHHAFEFDLLAPLPRGRRRGHHHDGR
jgi:molybdopterin-guanine dinucleotide biosynthesis protein